ncbi:MAG: tail fiber domain-containing protein [Verrucomicrobia bacterium]|nr:tail fiber domain-containing protein [Verrucomicrobiota bacterium]
MKQILPNLLGSLIMFWILHTPYSTAVAQTTAFTYQGRLNDNGAPANGQYDLRLALFDAANDGAQKGNAITNIATGVSNGLFTVTVDFGNQFSGADRWLDIAVRTNVGSAFTAVAPRQLITSAPYAIKAAGVDAAGITGTISPALIGSGSFSGSFSGNAAGLTNLEASQLSGTVPASALANAWKLTGNSGTISNTHFLGTTDSQPLELKVNAQRVLRFERDTNTVVFGSLIPNIIGGYESNIVTKGVGGATIAGGGGPQWYGATLPHQVGGAFSTIGGGVGNVVLGVVSTIAGGERGFIGSNAFNAFIGGGAYNSTEAYDAAIPGGRGNNIGDSSSSSVIGGGSGNSIGTNSSSSVIGGGNFNSISYNAANAVIPGGNNNAVGAGALSSFAAGAQAKVNHAGTFVWADRSGSDFVSTAANQFLVRATGGVGIGTASPGAQLEVRTTAANANAIRFGYASAGASGNLIAGLARVSIATDDLVERFVIRQGSGNVGIGLTGPTYQLQLNTDSAAKPNGGSWANSSDARLKRNIAPLTNALERLNRLRGVTFEWVNPEDHANQHGPQGGFIAQEVEKVFPKWITEVDGAEHDRTLTDNRKIKSLTLPFEFDALVVEAIKEQQAQIQTRDREINELKQRLAALEQRFSRLKLNVE